MRFYYQPTTRGLFIDELGNIPNDAYEISEQSYLDISKTAVSITNPLSKDDSGYDPDWKPEWIIPAHIKNTANS